ncbi:MAG TPA: hypothetical protein DDY14_01115 [Chromatiaceae bacterium]|jgi:hypothetical protein|nr:MAG: hypothetical protein N838_19115 [Thiohalocapsa sp. PB-PSB1]QQO55691.1 MAG: hypothetical protein N838_22410 [Thiohalocapsa sp. PB-PSB1]HBG93933.1 hypothetical protein [Chromatiaceae bacterium]HCS88741.1 hypothetical protein [Chromatiaceae bacterium]
MKISHPRPGKITIRKSRIGAAVQLAFFLVFFAFWYSGLPSPRNFEGQSDLFILLFWVVPVFALPDMVRQAKVLLRGEVFSLDKDVGVIERNGARLAWFRDVERIQIRTIRDSDGDDEHRLSVVLNTDEKLRIHQSSDSDEVNNLAEDLADILKVEITRKG